MTDDGRARQDAGAGPGNEMAPGDAAVGSAGGADRETASVRIADEVVSAVAAMAATEVEGVAGMAGGLAVGLSEMLGRRNPQKGVKVEVQDRSAQIELTLSVKYGVRIPDVAARVQENVRRVVEQMTGLKVSAVHVHVTGVETAQPQESGSQRT